MRKFGLYFLLAYTIVFQNCSTKINPLYLQSTDMSSLNQATQIPVNHPVEQKSIASTQKNLYVNRDYVLNLFKDIFTSTNSSVAAVPELDSILENWANNRGAQFGLGCDGTSSYSGRDCGGDISSSNLPTNVDHNSVRESYHIQLCRQILGTDEAVKIVLSKLSNALSYPDKVSMIQVYNLFYRGDDPNNLVLESLVDFDKSLAEANEPVLERWRGLILQVCESTAWQNL